MVPEVTSGATEAEVVATAGGAGTEGQDQGNLREGTTMASRCARVVVSGDGSVADPWLTSSDPWAGGGGRRASWEDHQWHWGDWSRDSWASW